MVKIRTKFRRKDHVVNILIMPVNLLKIYKIIRLSKVNLNKQQCKKIYKKTIRQIKHVEINQNVNLYLKINNHYMIIKKRI
jgi:hypothetical protein